MNRWAKCHIYHAKWGSQRLALTWAVFSLTLGRWWPARWSTFGPKSRAASAPGRATTARPCPGSGVISHIT